MTHFADLSSWEMAQRLNKVMPLLESSDVKVIAVGLGSPANARAFASIHNFPLAKLHADPQVGVNCYSRVCSYSTHA